MRAQNINKIMRVGIYHRLSVKDSNSNESESIANQRRITSDYVKKRGWILVEEYSDDGYAGSDFARPGFLALTKAIEAGLIDCVIVKDHSRLGRDVQLCNYYRETYFPNHNTRYIAIIDNFDSYNQRESSIDIEAIKDVINEAKLREISISTRRTKATNGALGMFMNNIPPFGYTLSAEDKHKFVIDPYAASIVRRIFELYNSGENMRRIAGILNAEGIVNPREYYYRRIDKPNPFTTQSKAWSTNTIGQMLKNRAYVGDMVSGKRVNATYKRDCKRISIPEDEQTVVENMHEPIVSREDFLRAKELREKHAHRQTRKGNKPPYTGGCP